MAGAAFLAAGFLAFAFVGEVLRNSLELVVSPCIVNSLRLGLRGDSPVSITKHIPIALSLGWNEVLFKWTGWSGLLWALLELDGSGGGEEGDESECFHF